MNEEVFYRLAAGVEAVPLSEDGLLFRSGTLAVKTEGSMATLLRQNILPSLTAPRSLTEIETRVGTVPPEALRESLDSLVDAGVLRRGTKDSHAPENVRPFAAFTESLGVEWGLAAERLRQSRVGIFGLEAEGAHLATELSRLGLGSCVLADEFPAGAGDSLLFPGFADRPGVARERALADLIRESGAQTAVETAGALSRERVEQIAQSCHLLIGCFDRGYETAQHWVNHASIATGKPALYAELRTHMVTLGPGVYPRETGCYMCYRMRRVASETSYDEAMAYERFLNERKMPSLSCRPTAPYSSSLASSLLLAEATKLLVLHLPMTLAGRVLELDTLTLDMRQHEVLQHPDCPACAEHRQKPDRPQPGLAELRARAQTDPVGDLRALTPRLVSARTGVVRRLELFTKDTTEPAVPYIVRADVSNHRFLPSTEHDTDTCSGKGITPEDARVSALGEAVERYSAGIHSAAEVRYARRSELRETSLDPRELVLYDSSQYVSLPYAPYDDNRLGWVVARSLVSDSDVLVPALGVFMNYRAREPEEFLFPITSNGLATGPSLVEAVWRAACEVIERDAFLIAWLNRLPTRSYHARSHPDSRIAHVVETYARRGVEIGLHRLPTDHEVPVFAAIAREDPKTGGPAAVVGLGVDADPARAGAKAVLEVCQVRPSLRRRMRSPESATRLSELLEDHRNVATIDDHDLLYASHRALPKLSFWLDTLEESFPCAPPCESSAAESLATLVSWLAARRSDLLYVNLTPPDMACLGLYTVRAVLPGFQPIDFGWKERRLGGTRARTLPMKIGMRVRPANWEELNHDPHPLA